MSIDVIEIVLSLHTRIGIGQPCITRTSTADSDMFDSKGDRLTIEEFSAWQDKVAAELDRMSAINLVKEVSD